MEAGQVAVFQWDAVVVADELHEHRGDENDEVSSIAMLVFRWEHSNGWVVCSSLLCGGVIHDFLRLGLCLGDFIIGR